MSASENEVEIKQLEVEAQKFKWGAIAVIAAAASWGIAIVGGAYSENMNKVPSATLPMDQADKCREQPGRPVIAKGPNNEQVFVLCK